MTKQQASNLLAIKGFIGGYYGPGWKSINNIHGFMARYPRGKGIKAHERGLLDIYDACKIYVAEESRTRSYVKIK